MSRKYYGGFFADDDCLPSEMFYRKPNGRSEEGYMDSVSWAYSEQIYSNAVPSFDCIPSAEPDVYRRLEEKGL